MALELFIAGKYLKAKRKEGFISLITFLSVAGVTVGVMALVVVIAVMSGAETDFRKRILGLEPHILVMNYSGKFDNYSHILSDLDKREQIKGASPILFAQAMIRSQQSFSGVMVRGIDPEKGFSLVKGFNSEQLKKVLNKGTSNGDLPGIILGQELANSVRVIKGDKVILMSPNGFISPMGHIPSMKRFVVTDTFDSGMYEYDSVLAYVHLKEAQRLSNVKNKISAIGIWIEDVFNVKPVKDNLSDILSYPFYLRDWMDINKSLFAALKLEKTAMFIILTLIILVAAFNIASALIMMVMEKTKDIAVLKAMGATNKAIRRIFILKGMIIGLLGTFIGTISGVAICFILKRYDFIQLPDAYPFSTLPVQLEYFDVLIIAVSAIIICFFSTLYPSYKASKMDPVEALRYG
ncbi:MAG: lipoprotein-releasing ABC transporter permease subunit [Desulfobacula sp.]|uniref:lipoprotein-releasing ABC transporter permease subunit n=1 Tax=Desulfobacula sp. TaxID=2593537 RepID=UPI0025C4983F|nr:lipoprotein-releasing ABC transporter permease subunit [Desulfobacula sp.]MCD4721568.1 lipoprotein-releasing ABC transporter permease subunit [Desulfobacula sp.]